MAQNKGEGFRVLPRPQAVEGSVLAHFVHLCVYCTKLEPIFKINDARLVLVSLGYKTKNFPSFLYIFGGGVGGADKKWKGNFWFCFAASDYKMNILYFCLWFFSVVHFSVFAARRGASSRRLVVA